MFVTTRGIGSLDVQLLYYRGFRECRASGWVSNPATLQTLMGKISCEAGRTQIERVLKHGIAESKLRPVQAMVFVGDCVEEPVDTLADLAGQLNVLALPVFIFQEGYNPAASFAFGKIASLSGGAHCQFDVNSAHQLGELLNAVAAYAAGGNHALQRLSGGGSKHAAFLLKQLSP